jgi:hypothetical protein
MEKYYLINKEDTHVITNYGRRPVKGTGIRTNPVDRLISTHLFTTNSSDLKVVAEELIRSYYSSLGVINERELESVTRELSEGYKLVDYKDIEEARNTYNTVRLYRDCQNQNVQVIKAMIRDLVLLEDDDLLPGYLHGVFKEVESLKARVKEVYGNKEDIL